MGKMRALYILPNKVLLHNDDLRIFVKGKHPFLEQNLSAVLAIIIHLGWK